MSRSSPLDETIARVMAFSIDAPDKSLRFEDRLARENQWSLNFARRVIDEYKRFCVLALHAGHRVTPSEAVDQVWHLHLTYTRSYWDRFCDECLGQPLHHEPTAGGASEGAKYHDWYAKTLESYLRLFHQEPPPDIWPAPQQRFQHASRWRWVNQADAWVVPKRPWRWFAAAIVLFTLVTTGAGCQSLDWINRVGRPLAGIGLPPFTFSGSEFLIFYFVLAGFVLSMIAYVRLASPNHDPLGAKRATAPEQLSIEDIAVLAGGGSRLIQAALAGLYRDNHVQLQTSWWRSTKWIAIGDGPQRDGLRRELFIAIQTSRTPDFASVAKPFYERSVDRLEEMQLRHTSRWYSLAGLWATVGLLLLGATRIVQGLFTAHPVEYLIVGCIIFGLVSVLLNYRQTMTKPQGQELLLTMREKQHPSPASSEQSSGMEATVPAASPELFALSVALMGTTALADIPEFQKLHQSLQQVAAGSTNGSSSSGCGSGCGAGCGGGGCGGGCGGCGG